MGRSLGILSTLLGLVALAAAIWWIRRPDDRGPEAAPRPPFVLPVTLATLERTTLAPRVPAIGTVRSPSRATLAFETGGVLAEISVREVDRVTSGQVLARLRARDEELSVAQAQADLALVRRELEKLEAGTREEEKRRLAAELAEREADEALALSEVRRAEKLLEDDVVSAVDLDRRRAELAAAEARSRAKAAELAEAEAGTRAEDIAIAQARLDVAAADLALAERELAKTRLVAPHDGIVLARHAAQGDYLPLGGPVLDVVDLEDIEIQVEIPGRYALDLGEDPPVVLTADDLPGYRAETTLTARVPVADERSRNFVGLIRFDAEDPRAAPLRPGMFVRIELSLRPRVDALVMPSDGVLRNPDGNLVVRAREEEGGLVAELVDVRVLGSDGDRSAVEGLTTELRAGDRVVVTGVDRAFPGAPLRPSPEPGAEPQAAPGAPSR